VDFASETKRTEGTVGAAAPSLSWLAQVWYNTKEFSGAAGGRSLLWPRWFVLRGFGLIFVFAFLGIVVEGQALAGPNGISPAALYLKHLQSVVPGFFSGFINAPSFFWLDAGAGTITAVSWIGFVSAVALVFNLWPRLTLFVCWASFLSFVATWAEFTPSQQDGLLLEAALLSMAFAPPGIRPGLGATHPPRPLVVFMMRWLLLRVMLLSGLVKILSDGPLWRNFTAMDVMYETSPSPTVTGYWIHQLPHAYHVFEIWFTYAAELLAPLLALFGGRRGRWLAFGLWTMLQAGIQLTTNFGWLNTAAFALGLLLLDDEMLASAARRLHWAAPRDFFAEPAAPRAPGAISPWRLHGLRAALGLHFAFTLYYFADTCGGPFENPPAAVRLFKDFRSANGYSLYARFEQAHFQIDLEGSNDGGRTWRTYPLRHLPQMPESRPEFIAPYFPRFDSTLHAASLHGTKPSIVTPTAAHLLALNPQVLALFERDPFPDRPPTVIRMRRYRFTFTDPATLRHTGRYWIKEFAGDYQPAMFIDEKGDIAQFDLGPADAALRAGNHGAAYAEYERQYRLGNLEAGFRLVDMMARGLGMPVQPERVFALYSDLAGGGEVKGMHNVAVCYEHGIGVAPNMAKACEYYRRAAELGHFASLHTLGRLAAEDRLTPRNDALGLASLAIAASRAADDEAALVFVRANQPALVAKLKARMSASELAEAKALAVARRAVPP
jgi:lipase maturation factor 1